MRPFTTPDMQITHYEQIYESFESGELHHAAPLALGRLACRLYNPDAIFQREVLDTIQESRTSDMPIIMVSNHIRTIDQDVIIAAMNHEPNFMHHIVGNSIIWAKAEYWLEGPLTRLRMNQANAVPVFRELLAKQQLGTEYSSRVLAQASLRLVDLSLHRMDQGHNVYIFPEGTRNTGNPKKLLDVKSGIGNLAFKAWHDYTMNAVILPVGVAYDVTAKHPHKKPLVLFGNPINSDSSLTIGNINQTVAEHLQTLTSDAHTLIELRVASQLNVR